MTVGHRLRNEDHPPKVAVITSRVFGLPRLQTSRVDLINRGREGLGSENTAYIEWTSYIGPLEKAVIVNEM